MCLLANRTQSSTRSHPFSPGPSHAVEFQKCLIALFNSKSVFINLFHSFIYFHRQFVIALSKPFDKFLSHSSPCTAIFTDNEVKTTESLNASPSTTFLCYYNYKLLPSTPCLWAGKNKNKKLRYPSGIYELCVKLICMQFSELYFCPIFS